MLVHIRQIVKKAQKGRYAVAAFNTMNLETTQGIIAAAEKTGMGVIIQTSESTIRYAGLETIFGIVASLAKKASVPVAMHLDHGKDMKVIRECLKVGYSSVHMDASEEPFATNVAMTKRAVKLGHARRAWVQGELGSFLGREGMTRKALAKELAENDISATLTDPEKAAEYVKKTGVDTLAVAVGQLHGSYRGKEKLDLKRLAAIHEKVRVPLVLHGGSGLPTAHLRKSLGHGVRIINTDTDLRIPFTTALKKALSGRISTYDPRKRLAPARDALARAAIRKIRLYSGGKA